MVSSFLHAFFDPDRTTEFRPPVKIPVPAYMHPKLSGGGVVYGTIADDFSLISEKSFSFNTSIFRPKL